MDIEVDLSTVFILLGAFFGILIGAVHLFFWWKRDLLPNLFSGLFFIDLGIALLLALNNAQDHPFDLFLLWEQPLHCLFAPLAYLYVRAFLAVDFRFRPVDWLVFLPAALVFLYFLPLYLGEAESRFAFLEENVINGYSRPFLIFAILKVSTLPVFLIPQILIFRNFSRDGNPDRRALFSLHRRWMKIFIGIQVFFSIAFFSMLLSEEVGPFGFNPFIYGNLLIGLLLVFLGSFFLFFPEVFYGPWEYREQVKKEKKTDDDAGNVTDPLVSQAMVDRLQQFMKKTQVYLDPRLNLIKLADSLDMHPKQLSTLINDNLNQNFNDFVNACRVKAAKKLLRDPANDQFSIDGIGRQAGFGSRAAFYKVFKAIAGMTPAEFKRRSQQKSY